MSNVHQLPSQTHQTSQTMLLSCQARNDPLNLNEYVMSDSRHPRLDALLQSSQATYQANVTVVPESPYSAFTSPLQVTPRDVASSFETSSTGKMGSPLDRRGSLDFRGGGSFSEVSYSHGSVEPFSDHRRTSIGVTVPTYSVDRTRSIGESSATSRTSSRGPGGLRPDEALPVHDAGLDGSNDAYHALVADTDTREPRDHPPPWSELKTKAGKERKRLPLACIACRRKKIRCSGEKPACRHCLRSRIPCVYKVTARKAAPRTDYMAMLDKRLRRMEDRVIKIIPKDESRDFAAIGRAAVKPAPSGPSTKAHGGKKRDADEAFGAELDEWSSTDAHRAARPPDHPSKVQDAKESRLLTEGANSLPAKDIQEHLAEVFFDCVYGQSYHLLHKPSYMRRLRAGTVPPVLILAVCAISARFSTHPQVASEPAFLRGECWAAPAREIALDRYDQPNITILTVLLLLGLHEFGTCQGGRSWMLGGMAMRMAYALQLHRELDRDPAGRKNDDSMKLSFTDREIRRRTMWSCFLMDRFNSSGTERPTFANEENIHVQLPVKEALFQMELPGSTEGLDSNVSHLVSSEAGQVSDIQDNMGVAAYMIRIIALWGRVIRYLNLGGKERDPHPLWSPDSQLTLLKTQVENFWSSLPASLHYTDENLRNHAAERIANQFLFMHVCYHQIILFMHRFAIPSASCGRTAKEMPDSVLADSLNAALDAAKQISRIISVAENHQVVAPFAGYCAFLSSTVHIWGIFSKNPELEASSKRDLAHNVKYLSKMKKYWGMFHFMTESLKDIYRQHADAALQGTGASEITHEAGVFQYGDWFTKYPHGVSRTDFEDPATDVKKESEDVAVLSQKSNLQSVEAFFASKSPSSQTEHQRRPTKSRPKYTVPVSNKQQIVPLRNYDTEPKIHVTQQWPVIPFSSPETPDENLGIEAAFQHPHPSQIYQQQQQQHQQQRQQQQQQQQQQHQYPTGYGPSDFALPPQQHNMLPQLDRHLVYGAYASLDTTAATTPLPSHSQNHSAWGDLNMTGFAPGFVQEPTSAWFMPFNMEPPEISGEDPFVAGGVNNSYHMAPPPPPS